jgi:hypothetical protein
MFAGILTIRTYTFLAMHGLEVSSFESPLIREARGMSHSQGALGCEISCVVHSIMS